MKIIEPKVEQLIQKPGIKGVYEIIDQVAGICYGRHELHEDSKAFVEKLISMGHMRPLEFGTVYLKSKERLNILHDSFFCSVCTTFNYESNKYKTDTIHHYTTNLRFIVENNLMEYVEDYWCEPTEHHTKRPCFLFTCSRAIADEFRTHITLSSMMKSTRYCKVSNLEICIPRWKASKTIVSSITDYDSYLWFRAMKDSEEKYKELLENGLKPQEARGVLPMDMATELCMCGFYANGDLDAGWDRFLKMRCDKAAHEDAQYLANQVKEILQK